MEQEKKKVNFKIIIPIVIAIVVIAIVGIVVIINKKPKEMIATTEDYERKETSNLQAENAEVLDWEKVYKEYEENKARAMEMYNKKTYKYTADVSRIDNNYCEISNSYRYDATSKQFYYYNTIKCYLPKDDLIKLNKGDKIEIIGTLNLAGDYTTIKSAHLLEIIKKAED